MDTEPPSNPSPTVLCWTPHPRAAENPYLGDGYWAWRESGLAPPGGAVVERHTLADTGTPVDPGFWMHRSRAAKADHRLPDIAAAQIATLRQRTREVQAEDPNVDVKPVNIPRGRSPSSAIKVSSRSWKDPRPITAGAPITCQNPRTCS